MSILNDLSGAVLRQAASIKDKIESLQSELAELVNNTVSIEVKVKAPKTKNGGMSAAGRAKIAAAQKARWAKVNAGKTDKAAKPVKAKRKMSAAGRAKIIAAQKARWAKIKAAKGASK